MHLIFAGLQMMYTLAEGNMAQSIDTVKLVTTFAAQKAKNNLL